MKEEMIKERARCIVATCYSEHSTTEWVSAYIHSPTNKHRIFGSHIACWPCCFSSLHQLDLPYFLLFTCPWSSLHTCHFLHFHLLCCWVCRYLSVFPPAISLLYNLACLISTLCFWICSFLWSLLSYSCGYLCFFSFYLSRCVWKSQMMLHTCLREETACGDKRDESHFTPPHSPSKGPRLRELPDCILRDLNVRYWACGSTSTHIIYKVFIRISTPLFRLEWNYITCLVNVEPI